MAKAIKGVFKIVRGLEAELPILRIGELGYATDSNTLFVGDPDEGNVKINFNNEDRGMLNTVFKEMDKKIDAEPGKGLSTNDLTNELLEKILDSVSENFVINKIAEAQLDVDGSGVDLSGLASKDDLDGKVDKMIGYSLISDAELIRLASVSNYDDTNIKRDLDKKADINHQHDQYLTSIPSQYVTNTQLTAKGYATTSSVNASLSIYAKSSAIPTKISQLTDDVGYLISIPEEYVTDSELNIVLAPYALIADIPTKVGQLTNDKGYLTSIPEEYVTETELNNRGYATTAEVDQKIAGAVTGGTVDLSGYALKTEVPTKVGQLANDKGYLTSIPEEYVTETELNNITGVLSTLETSNKSTIVAAINELVNIVSKLQNIQIFGEIVLSTTSLNLTEGNTGTINVKMDRFITHNQTVTISSNNSGVTVSPSTLTFTSDNYNSNQAVTITAVQDDDTDDLTATLTFKSDKVENKTATVKVTDDDVNVTPQEDYMYYGRLSIEEVGGSVIQYSEITEDMIKTGKNIKKEVASTMGKTSLGDADDTAEGDYGIIAVPASKGYTVTTDNGFGGKAPFSEDVAGANGIDITIDGIEYKLYGDIFLAPGQIFFYID